MRVIQAVLHNHGFNVGQQDAVFGPKTKQAVMAFQRAKGLGADGVVGPKTWAALGTTPTNPVPTNPVPTNGTAHCTARLAHQPNGFGVTTGSITVNGHTYQFNSGSSKSLSVPQGLYRVKPHRSRRTDRGFIEDGVGFSFLIEDARQPNSDGMHDARRPNKRRTLLRIHPDGAGPGTAGCIGIKGRAATLLQFQNDMNAELHRHGGSCTLLVQ